MRVVPTSAALEFVGAATWEALSAAPARSSVFDDVPDVPHVRLGQQADLVVVAPATADLLARAAIGRADDLLTSTLLTARCPVLMAPAMHTEMWEHPATRANVATLRSRGVLVTDPASGRLTGADSGPGRLAEPDELLSLCTAVLEHPWIRRDLEGRSVLVTAGATREALDPVRYLTNHSSGLQGWALARVAALRGADVTLVTGPTGVTPPAGVTMVDVVDARDMHGAVMSRAARMDAVVMAAAVADHRPAEVSATKMKKGEKNAPRSIELVPNPDILADVSASARAGTVVVGFAAETGDTENDVLALGRVKLAAKGCDLLVVNDVSGGRAFGSPDNEAVLLSRDGGETPVSRRSKEAVAATIWDEVVSRLPSTVSPPDDLHTDELHTAREGRP